MNAGMSAADFYQTSRRRSPAPDAIAGDEAFSLCHQSQHFLTTAVT